MGYRAGTLATVSGIGKSILKNKKVAAAAGAMAATMIKKSLKSIAPSSSSDPVVTNQYDHKVLYKRKRASWRVRQKARRHKNFVNKVLAANDTRLEKQKIVFQTNKLNGVTVSGEMRACSGGLNLFGCKFANADFRDLSQIIAGLGATAASPRKIYFRSAILEATLLNPTSNDMFVECYYYRARTDTGTSAGTVDDIFTAGLDTTNLGGTTLTNTTYGTSPFQSKDFCEKFKIWKKTTTLLGAGLSMDVTLQSNKNRVIDTNMTLDKGFLKSLFQGIFIVYYGKPDPATGIPTVVNLAISSVRTYSCTIDGVLDAGTSLLTS